MPSRPMFRTIIFLILLAVSVSPGHSQQGAARPLDIPKNIRPYFVALLGRGPRYTPEQTPEAMDLLRQHLSYIRMNVAKKIYVFAGPFTDDGDVAGMIVLNAATFEDAKTIVNQDPAVRAGRFVVQLHSAMFAEIQSTPQY